ncbi:rCG40888 [Rattus norvegicus]|uniref:RCG40888 n=1 Tax=Rattus norvegicus TaxID=10116 RepID=A6KL17_RAT|nr:rCG40888 [Rattus norvegicus]
MRKFRFYKGRGRVPHGASGLYFNSRRSRVAET